MTELGYSDFDVTTWFALMAPAGTSESVIAKLQHESSRAAARPDVLAKLTANGIEPIGGTPAELATVIQSESRFWARLIRESGMKLPQ
jgi:tripartite-type tricarboxylate transporter receptor subunit TctC